MYWLLLLLLLASSRYLRDMDMPYLSKAKLFLIVFKNIVIITYDF